MITDQNGILILNQFSSIVKLPDMVTLNAGVDYSILTNTHISCNIVNSKQITLASPLENASAGDGVLVTIGDFSFKNIIDNINSTKDKIVLIKDLTDVENNIVESGTIEIKYIWRKAIKLINVSEGHYLIKPTNQKIVVRNSFIQPYVDLQDLTPKMVDVINLKESRLDSLNKTALKMIYSDLSGLSNYYDIIDDIDLWALLYLKIECFLESDDEIKDNSNSKCNQYKNKINSYIPSEGFVENEDGSVSTEIKAFSVGRWSL